MSQSYHAVLANMDFIFGNHEYKDRLVVDPFLPQTAQTILDLAMQSNAKFVWIAPKSDWSYVDPVTFRQVQVGFWNVHFTQIEATRNSPARMKRVTAWRTAGSWDEKRTITILFPEHDTWEWSETDPRTILRAILELEDTLGIPIENSPGATGRSLMKYENRLVSNHPSWIRKPQIDLSLLPCMEAGRDLAWKRPLTEYIPNGWYLHVYDKNSQYLSAATGAMLGEGDPIYYANKEYRTYDPELLGVHVEPMRPVNFNRAGLWRIEATVGDIHKDQGRTERFYKDAWETSVNRQWLPLPLYNEQEWVTTNLLKLLLDMGYSVSVFEGFEWEESHRTLESWARKIWNARARYSGFEGKEYNVLQLAYYSMKRIATASVGLLASDATPEKERAFYRPDWWATIVELAKARMIYNADRIGKQHGQWPHAFVVDALYYVSPEPDPERAVPTILARRNELGGYKLKQMLQITDEVRDAFSDEKTPGDMARIINQLGAWQHVS